MFGADDFIVSGESVRAGERVQAHGRAGDVLLAITTSGTSRNVVAAAKQAREMGVKVIALTGRAGTPVTELTPSISASSALWFTTPAA